MQTISLPQKPKYTQIDAHSGKFEILGWHPGYGTTLGNALRRVLLSSLEGAAISAVKIKGISHEFSTLPGVKEDMVQIILNLKKVRVKMHGDEPMKVTLKSKGEGMVTAKDIKCPTGVEIVNPDQMIATVTDKKTEFEAELEITKGIGYSPVEQQVRENKEIGVIAIDAIYTPMKRVNYTVEDMRVGKQTDFNKVTLEISTDGSITPEEAFAKAVEILISQISALTEVVQESEKTPAKEKAAAVEEAAVDVAEEADPLKTKVADLKSISARTLNVLEKNNIDKIKDIMKLTENELMNLDGMGDKGIKEIKKSIGEFGLTLNQTK